MSFFTGGASRGAVSSVILSPYGLSGVLTGHMVSPSDQTIADWQHFYPLARPLDADLPPLVEVAVGEKLNYYSVHELHVWNDDPFKNDYIKG